MNYSDTNEYWGDITNMYEKQRKKGIKKYGQVLEENKGMTIKERIEYAQEELIDGLMYLEHLKHSLCLAGNRLEQMQEIAEEVSHE